MMLKKQVFPSELRHRHSGGNLLGNDSEEMTPASSVQARFKLGHLSPQHHISWPQRETPMEKQRQAPPWLIVGSRRLLTAVDQERSTVSVAPASFCDSTHKPLRSTAPVAPACFRHSTHKAGRLTVSLLLVSATALTRLFDRLHLLLLLVSAAVLTRPAPVTPQPEERVHRSC